MIHIGDIRYSIRLLLRNPAFTLLTVLVLAGGLGLSTFTFSFLYTAMIRPLPLGEGDRIVRVDQMVDGRRRAVDAADVDALRGSLGAVRELGGYYEREFTLGRDGGWRTIGATVTDPVLFSVARTPAFMGRALLPSDAASGAEPVVVLSHRSWEVAFGADPSILDRPVPLDGVTTRVVGVMPEGFGFPVASEAWVPLPEGTMDARPGLQSLRLIGRLAPGASHASAAAEATPLLARLVAERDSSARGMNVSAAVESLPSVQFGEERMLVFTVLNLLAALILLLALVNAVNLLLARANERIRETAVRLALGASTGRLLAQGMWETAILCVAGGALGTAGAAWGLSAVTHWTRANMEGNLAFWWVWRMDRTTLACAGAFVTIAMVALGSVVSHRAIRTNVREVLQDGGARSGSRQVGRLSRALVAAQVTAVTVLMYFGVMAGVMAERAIELDPGFDTAALLQGGMEPPVGRYDSPSTRASAFVDVHARLAESAELDRVLFRRTLADGSSPGGRFELRDVARVGAAPGAFVVAVLGDLATIGARTVEGRALEPRDDADRAPVAMVSRSLAERYWRGSSPVGDQLRLAGMDPNAEWVTIVGVASDVPYGDMLSRDRSTDAIYLSLPQNDVGYSTILAHYRTSEAAGRQALRQAFADVDPLLVPDTVQPFDEMLRKMGLITTSVSRLFAGCFAFALLLALIGTFGLMSRSIGLRTREVGIRRALGATDGSLTRFLLGYGARQLGVGTLIATPLLGAVGFAFMHYFPVSGWVTLAALLVVPAAIVALILVATWVPTRKVLGVTPRAALWTD